jgi:NAD-dependent deacetylase
MTLHQLQTAAGFLSQAKNIAVLSGAGISKESGIPTFRDALTGYWENYEPEKLATRQGFLSDPPLVWRWYAERRRKLEEVQPNPGHYALATLETFKPVTIITQNIDGLHRLSGSSTVIELHGNLRHYKCLDCEKPTTIPLEDLREEPPLCGHCSGLIRPDVVWFGEYLPVDALRQAEATARSCDLMLVVGTSGLVYPAAGLPMLAKEFGATLVEVNPDETAITDRMDISLRGASGVVLPELVTLLGL